MAAWFHSWKPIGQALGPTTNRAFWRPLFHPEGSSSVLCCCCRSLSLEWRTVQLVLRLLVGYDVSGGRRSREVIRDTRDYRWGTSEADNRSYSRDVPDARTAPVDTPTRPCEPILAPLARLGSWLRAAVHRRARCAGPPKCRSACVYTRTAPTAPQISNERRTNRGTPSAERDRDTSTATPARESNTIRDAVDARERVTQDPRRCRRLI